MFLIFFGIFVLFSFRGIENQLTSIVLELLRQFLGSDLFFLFLGEACKKFCLVHECLCFFNMEYDVWRKVDDNDKRVSHYL